MLKSRMIKHNNISNELFNFRANLELYSQNNIISDGLVNWLPSVLEAAGISLELIDSEGKFLWVNSAFTKLTGYSNEEVYKKKINFLNSENNERESSFTSLEAIQNGKIWNGEVVEKSKNGKLLFLEQTILPINDHENGTDFFIIIKRDISGKKRIENELNETYIKYEELAYVFNESPAIGFLWAAHNGMPVEFVTENIRQLGYNPDDFYSGNISFQNIIHPKDLEKTINELYHRALIGEEKFKLTFRILNKSGKVRWVDNYLSVRHGEGGAITHFHGIILDITERIKAEKEARLKLDQLVQADKMVALGTLVSGVAHEINNPNNYVLLNSKLISKTWFNILPILEDYYKTNGDFNVGNQLKYSKIKESMPKVLEGISDGSKRIKNIVKELKGFARNEPWNKYQLVNVNQVINSAINLTKNLIEKTTNHFSIKLDEGIPLIKANSQRLEQVIINLIENSCQALTSNDQSVYVLSKFMKNENSVQILVADEGEGIPTAILNKIKDPFFTTKRGKGGTGLGLAVSSRIILNHNGQLLFESELNKGTKAIIKLPVTKEFESNKESQ
ncbi:sporulation kinase A [bacterium BMS3Abin04]|nr:sporulation kinase A [bacterium BMS3Abin04]